MRALVLALACGFALPSAPVVATTVVPAQTVVVLAANKPAATPLVTHRGTTYSVTVTGEYSYDGWFGMADCGHADPAVEGGWEPRLNVTLDGTAICFAEPFSVTHSYTVTAAGTGAPFTFEIVANVGDTDDKGALVVTVTPDTN